MNEISELKTYQVLPEEIIEAKIVEIETTVPERLTLWYDWSGR